MKALKLVSLVSVTLTCLAPALLAQADGVKAEPYDATVRTEPGDVLSYRQHKTAGLEQDHAAGRAEPGDVLSYRQHKTTGIGEQSASQRPYRSDVRYPLKLFLSVIDSGGIRVEVNPIDEAPAWIVVCFDTGEGLVPAAVLDARNARQTTFDLFLDQFHAMPLSLFAVRFSPDGFLEFSEPRTAAQLAEEAMRRQR